MRSATLLFMLFITHAAAQPRTFLPVSPGKVFEFPRDHGSHPEFELEWWYVTGYLTTSSGELVGFQYTCFRRGIVDGSLAGMKSAWALDDVYLAHLALSHQGRGFLHDSRISRPGPSRARVGDLDVALEDWRLRRTSSPDIFHLEAFSTIGGLDITLTSRKPPTVHGADGRYLKGSDGQHSSHYVSLTRLEAKGTLEIDGTRHAVEGGAWFDHEFFTLAPGADTVGWDWMGLHLDDGRELMLYRFRPVAVTPGVPPEAGTGGGTLVAADGTVHPIPYGEAHFEPLRAWKSPRSGGAYPVGLRVRVPGRSLALDLAPHRDDQELESTTGLAVTYWEGLVEGRGEAGGRPVTARGYLELTGYVGKGPFSREQ